MYDETRWSCGRHEVKVQELTASTQHKTNHCRRNGKSPGNENTQFFGRSHK